MAAESFGRCFLRKFQLSEPYIYMIFVQVSFACLYFIAQASFNHGMSPHVYITYRQIICCFVFLPFAYFLERTKRPKLTLALFLEFFVLALFCCSLPQNMFFMSLNCTSPTFVASALNSTAALTFVLAIILRMEVVDIHSPRGIAKILGTLLSFSGVMTMALYKGPILKSLGHPLISISKGHVSFHENWLKGSILSICSCIAWSVSYILQPLTVKKYPAVLSLTTWLSFIGAAQSAVFTVIVQHEKANWEIGFNIDLWSTIYGGIVISGMVIMLQLWCAKKKGPVFITMFNPLQTILAAILSYFVLGEKLYTGCIIGAVIVIVGLYLLLWGKKHDQEAKMQLKEQSDTVPEEHYGPNVMKAEP